MLDESKARFVLLDGSRLITEACVRAGANVYVGYPITPSNYLYLYSSRRFPVTLSAPDEITTLQWMAGLAASGKLPVTATSFPGLALMIESINMAYMMELPMLIILVQRLGPSTGSATVGAQGDILLLHGLISGGYPLPVFCLADLEDCWQLPPLALQTAVHLRSPVILLTSKEMVMTEYSFDLEQLADVEPIQRSFYDSETPYQPYRASDGLAAPFLPVGDSRHQVRLTASTHDPEGIIQTADPAALENTLRLQAKIETGTAPVYRLDEQPGARSLVITYGVSTGAAKEAVNSLRAQGVLVSLLVLQTLLPVPEQYFKIMENYSHIILAEENLQGQMAQTLFGQQLPRFVKVVSRSIGRMVRPTQIIREVLASV